MIKDMLPKRHRRRLLGWVVLALLASALGYAVAGLKAALDERETLPESLDRLENAGLAVRRERRTIDILGEVLERSTARIALLTKTGTSPGAAPLPDQELALLSREIAQARARVRNDQGLLSQLAPGTAGLLGRMVETLRQELDHEDHTWEVVAQYLAARHDNTSAMREDELLREFAASLMKIGQSVSVYQEGLREASAANSRMAREDDARLTTLLLSAAHAQRSVALHMALALGTFLLLAVALAAMILSSRVGRKRLPPDGPVRV
jgi:hypothetical protein